MTKRSFLLTSIAVLLLPSCSQEYYINDGCTVGDTYCNEGIVYKCVNAKAEGLQLENLEFISPKVSPKNTDTDNDKNEKNDEITFWQNTITCQTKCDTSTQTGSCECPENCKLGCNDDGTCKTAEGCKNGKNDDGTCLCPVSCTNGCNPDGSCSCPKECINGCNENGSCKPSEGCINGLDAKTGKCSCLDACPSTCNPNGSCSCPKECANGCNDNGSCKLSEGCINGLDAQTGKCLCLDACSDTCNPDGSCSCSPSCINGCNDDGSCIPTDGCKNGIDQTSGACLCPNGCKNGCDNKGEKCLCLSTCLDGCDEVGACTCKATCVTGSSCDKTTGQCACIERCKFGCDADGSCAEVCENFECKGENEQCKAVEKADKFEAVCVDLCTDVNCKSDEYCKMGKCIYNDANHNHMNDKFETAPKQGEDCRKYSDCDSVPGRGDGFCDSFIGYKCSTKCTDDEQCVIHQKSAAEPYRYTCRKTDGRCTPNAFITVWDIPDNNKYLRIPTSTAGTSKFTIDWGDGTKLANCTKTKNELTCENLEDTELNNGDLLHTYRNKGTYTVKITGKYDGWGWPRNAFSNVYTYPYQTFDNSPTKLHEVKTFGPVGLSSFAFAFCSPDAFSKVDIPDASKMQNMDFAFFSADSDNNSKFNLPLEHWDMSHVTDMCGMFRNALKFNQPLDHWDTSSVQWMGTKPETYIINGGDGMFTNATAFNRSLEHWDTSNVVSISHMFQNASAFNGALTHWDTSNVKYMNQAFHNASKFNQPLNHWNTTKVIEMNQIFKSATSFNQPLDQWDTSNITNMSFMFSEATAFNGDIGSWNTSKVTNMSNMFSEAKAFNKSIESWDVFNVTDMNCMFNVASSFNQPLNKWNVTSVTNMSDMFHDAKSFNQPLNNWNTWNVTDMSRMFQDATSFDQDLSAWSFNKESTPTVTDIFKDSKVSPENYCKIYKAWIKYMPNLKIYDLGKAGMICN